jgi:hypothetical protein
MGIIVWINEGNPVQALLDASAIRSEKAAEKGN